MADGGFGPFGWNVNCRLHTGRPGPGGCGGGGGAIAAGKLRRHSDSDWLGAKVVVAVKGVAAAGSGGAA
jgi:hypothetical protein